MTLRIDPGETGPLEPFEHGDTLGEAVEDVFPIDTPEATLWWHDIPIPLGYRYDIGSLLDDIVAMLEEVTENESGEYFVAWPANTFRVDWTMTWGDDQLRVDSRWESVIGGREARLVDCPSLQLPRQDFIEAWHPLLHRCYSGLREIGVTTEQLPDLRRLEKLLEP